MFLPILTALASVTVLVVVNVRAAKQASAGSELAQARRVRRMETAEEDDYDIFSDSASAAFCSEAFGSTPKQKRRKKK